MSRNDALMDNSPEDMHIEDNFIGDIKPEKIEKKEEKISLSFNLKRKIDTENKVFTLKH